MWESFFNGVPKTVLLKHCGKSNSVHVRIEPIIRENTVFENRNHEIQELNYSIKVWLSIILTNSKWFVLNGMAHVQSNCNDKLHLFYLDKTKTIEVYDCFFTNVLQYTIEIPILHDAMLKFTFNLKRFGVIENRFVSITLQ